MTHSLYGSFQNFMHSCTHITKFSPFFYHYNIATSLKLPKDIAVIWDEELFRLGSKPREIITSYNQLAIKGDMRLFGYILTYIPNNKRHIIVGTIDEVVKETCSIVYHDETTNCTCQDMYEE